MRKLPSKRRSRTPGGLSRRAPRQQGSAPSPTCRPSAFGFVPTSTFARGNSLEVETRPFQRTAEGYLLSSVDATILSRCPRERDSREKAWLFSPVRQQGYFAPPSGPREDLCPSPWHRRRWPSLLADFLFFLVTESGEVRCSRRALRCTPYKCLVPPQVRTSVGRGSRREPSRHEPAQGN